MIHNIQITNFRGLKSLKLEGFKRINLIVGANNAGKTSFLEAIHLAARPGEPGKLPTLFAPFSDNPRRYFNWMISDGASEGFIKCDIEGEAFGVKFTSLRLDSQNPRIYGYSHQENLTFTYERNYPTMEIRSVSTQQRHTSTIVPDFVNTVRSPAKEKQLEYILSKIDSRIRSARLDIVEKEQTVSIDIGLSQRVPLSQVGQGVYRIVSLICDLFGSHTDLFLVDEIENGIHWSGFPTIWKGLAQIAEEFDIQIFASTHSLECLRAAHEVFKSKDGIEAEEFAVIQLMRINGDIVGRVLEADHIEASIENDIELR